MQIRIHLNGFYAYLEPLSDGFRNYHRDGLEVKAEEMLLDRAQLLGLTAPEMTVLLGGLRSLGVTHNGYGNFTENPNELTNDYLVNLLDMSVSWKTNGTGNSFMKTIGIDSQLNSIEKIAKNKSRPVDVMKAVCGDEVLYSLNLIGWGMATDISVLAEGLRVFGGQRYNIASFFEIVKNKKRTAKLVVDGIEREDNFAFIIACNTKYVGKDMKMAPSAEIDDGKIDLIIVKEASSFTLFSVFPKLFDGSHVDHDACEYVHCNSFSIFPEEAGKLNIDGEIIGSSPVAVEMLKNGVELII